MQPLLWQDHASSMGEKARIFGPRSSAVTVGSSQSGQSIEGNSFPKLRPRPLPVDSDPPCSALARPNSPSDTFKVCSLVNVTFVFVGCPSISWAKQR